MRARWGALAAALALALAAPGAAQEPEPRTIPVQFVRAPLAQVLSSIAPDVGRAYLYSPEDLKGFVTIVGGGPVSPGEAVEILEAVLLVRGYASVPTAGGPRKVIPIESLGAEAPWRTEPLRAQEEAVTTLVRLHEVDAEYVANAIRPWLGPSTVATAYPASNSLILAGSEDRLRQVLLLVGALDQTRDRELLIRRLRHRGVEQVADLVEQAFGEGPPGTGPVQVWTDVRTNTLLARATPGRLAELRAFLEQLDRVPEGRGRLRLLPVRHADPERLAELLQGLADAAPRPRTDEAEATASPLLGRAFSVTVDPPSKTLLVQADPHTADLVTRVAAELDREPPRVAVEAIVFEVTSDDAISLGIDLLGSTALGNDSVAAGLSDPDGGGLRAEPGPDITLLGRVIKTLVIPITNPLTGEPEEVTVASDGAVITANGRRVETRVISRPHLVMTSGDEHEIFVGDNVPIPTSQTGADAVGALEVRQNVERQDVGVRMRLRPQVGEAGGLHLELELESSDVVPSIAGDVREVGPTLRQRKVATSAPLRDGEILVVGFAAVPRFVAIRRGVPFLMAIPVIGNFFRIDTTERLESQLVVAVQATLLRSSADDIALSIRRRLGMERALARVGPLAARSDAPFALLVATRSLESDARAIAEGLGGGAHPGEVVAWELDGEPRYDVYLTGFASLAEAAAAAVPVQAAGWTPELAVVPRGADGG
jgi:general secretion pathway protein D